jgi:serine/threonine protein kinase
VADPRLPGIIGGYELVRPLGRGGMAEVWLARKPVGKTGSKYVAIKLIAEHYVGDERYTRMFRAEAELAAVLSHANIAQVFDEGEDDGRSYLVMEWVDGLNLLKLVEKLAWVDDEQRRFRVISYIIGQLLHALHYAHSIRSADGHPLGVVHRDVSPQNVLVSNNGEVKLTDFGVAHHNFEESSGVHVKGKVRYMSPEQISGKTRLPTVDLYAVGALLHELLDGKKFRVAFEDGQDLFAVVLSGYVPPLSRPAPPELDRLRLRLLEPNPAHRIQTAEQALALLRRFSGYGDAREELTKLCGSLTGVVHPRTGPGQSSKVALAEQATTRWGGREAPALPKLEPGSRRRPPPPPVVSRASSSLKSGSTTVVKGRGYVRATSTAVITGMTESVLPQVAPVSILQIAPADRMAVPAAGTEVIGPSMIMEMRSGSGTELDIMPSAVAADGTDTQHDILGRRPNQAGSAPTTAGSIYTAVGLLLVLVAAISAGGTWLWLTPKEGAASEVTGPVIAASLAWPWARSTAAAAPANEEGPEPLRERSTSTDTDAVTGVAAAGGSVGRVEPAGPRKADRPSTAAKRARARSVARPVANAVVRIAGSSGLDEVEVRLGKSAKQTFAVDDRDHEIKPGRKLIEWRKSPNDPWQPGKRWNFEPGQRSIIYVGKNGPRVRLG